LKDLKNFLTILNYLEPPLNILNYFTFPIGNACTPGVAMPQPHKDLWLFSANNGLTVIAKDAIKETKRNLLFIIGHLLFLKY